MNYPKTDYKLLGFEKSKAQNKKYAAIIQNKKTKKTKRINFGDSRYEHFKDSTGLNIYSKLNHGDKERRKRYRERHKVYLDESKYSPAYFSWFYLW